MGQARARIEVGHKEKLGTKRWQEEESNDRVDKKIGTRRCTVPSVGASPCVHLLTLYWLDASAFVISIMSIVGGGAMRSRS